MYILVHRRHSLASNVGIRMNYFEEQIAELRAKKIEMF